jgi:hypothetical protein
VRRRHDCLVLETPPIPVEQGLVVDVPCLALDLDHYRCFGSPIWYTSNETLFLNTDEDDSLSVTAVWSLV